MVDARNIHHLCAQPLTAEAFAPFGSLAALDATGGRSVNQERGRRIPGLGDLAHDSAAVRPVLDVYHLEPSLLPFAIACFERHVLTSQVFIPIRCARLLIAVAPDDADGRPDVGRAMAFVSNVSAILHYRAGVWHSPLVALDEPAVLSMLMWEAGDARDCEEITPSDAIDIML
jgi:ureidoglycolate lyase